MGVCAKSRLTPLDFFLWGYVKNKVYSSVCLTREDMEAKIIAAFNSVSADMLRNVTGSMMRRTQLCIQQDGKHFEPFIVTVATCTFD